LLVLALNGLTGERATCVGVEIDVEIELQGVYLCNMCGVGNDPGGEV
jgi:hypothetical protein